MRPLDGRSKLWQSRQWLPADQTAYVGPPAEYNSRLNPGRE